MKWLSALLVSIGLIKAAGAGLSPYYTLEGKIVSFNEGTVTLQVGKRKIQVPRKLVTDVKAKGEVEVTGEMGQFTILR